MNNHPFFYSLVRLELRKELRAKGLRFQQINEHMELVDDGLIDVAQGQAGAAPLVGAIGDGTLIKLITDFLKSDLGKALIAALLALLGL